MKTLARLLFRFRYYRVGLDIAVLEEQQQRIQADLIAARDHEARLLANAIARGVV